MDFSQALSSAIPGKEQIELLPTIKLEHFPTKHQQVLRQMMPKFSSWEMIN